MTRRRGWMSGVMASALLMAVPAARSQSANGEIEDRPAPVGRRICLGGVNAGSLCNENGDCPGSTCKDRNVFNISVAVHYDAPAADITAVQTLIGNASATILDVTDGQSQIGQATIHNNAFGTTQADLRVFPSTCTSGTSLGAACTTSADCPGGGSCGVWWQANTGSWKTGGSMQVSRNFINTAVNQGPTLAHEFVHLVFDARDEYETRPGCGNTTAGANCPDAATIAAGQQACLMDGNGTELCWGQGSSANLTDVSAGNHDATNVTEQSQCRSNRSCWDQVLWSWPDTMRKPAAAPDPGSGGVAVTPTNFVVTNDTVRVVLVLDESGSMDWESPKRIERLKVAAKDFVALAENGTEVGIVSFATDAETGSGRVNVAIGALGANRSAWTTAIDGLTPSTRTSIGRGLQKAKDLIDAAGGVTGNTYVVLMTDGVNNEPSPQTTADADLQAKLDMLLNAGVPVYVTCTGGDLGLQSQCSEIANATNGFFVDSADAGRLPEAFVDLHERIAGHEGVGSLEGYFSKVAGVAPKSVWVDPGSDSASFVLLWREANTRAKLTVIDPDGRAYDTFAVPQGRFVRVANPKPGEWKMQIDGSSSQNSRFVARAYTRNRIDNMAAAVRYPTVLPGDPIYVYAYPRGPGGGVTKPNAVVRARVTLPNGTVASLDLRDDGRVGGGDDIAADAIFTGVYQHTMQKGAYQFLIDADVDRWFLGEDAHVRDGEPRPVRFVREVRLSAAVGEPGDVVTKPEDDPRDVPGQGPGGTDPCDRRVLILLWVILVLVMLCILLVWRCCCRRHDATVIR